MHATARKEKPEAAVFRSKRAAAAAKKAVIPTVGFKYLSPTLPAGFAGLFHVRKAGRYWGLTVECPVCHDRPPRECDYGLRRWRWLSVHLAKIHRGGR